MLKLIIILVILLSSYPAFTVFANNNSELVFYRYQEKTDEWVITDRGQIDERIKIHGYGFEVERRYDIYLSSQKANVADKIDEKINTYKQIAISYGDQNAEFSASFIVPRELNDGKYYRKVVYGTYYVYVVNSQSKQIVAMSTFIAVEEQIEVNTEQGHIGDWITINGDGFSSNQQVVIYFSSNAANIGDYIEHKVTAYEIAGFAVTNASGVFSNEVSFRIPDTLSKGNIEVHSGDYYFYATYYSGKRRIEAISRFAVVIPAISLDPASGVIGTEVQINGKGFKNNRKITVKYDDKEIDVIGGENVTDSSGQFKCTIIIPSSSAGDHLITVTDTSGYRHEAQFTVEPRLKIEPTSGVTGTQVKINGADFRSNQTIAIKYDNEYVGVVSGDNATDDTGKFTCNIVIPESIAGSHTITVVDEHGNSSKAVYHVKAKIAVASALKAVVKQEKSYLIQVSGTGFGKEEDVTLSLDDNKVSTVPRYLRTDDKGSFNCSFEVFSFFFTGTGTVKAQGSKSGSAETELTIMDTTQSKAATPTSIILSPATSSGSPGYAGMLLAVNGTGFTANTKITLGYTNNDEILPVASSLTDSNGDFSAAFNVPSSVAGSHAITATDGINSAESVFFMEADSPPTPKLLSPQLKKTVESELFFYWEDVYDVSGVSYILQVSSTADFTTLLVNKKGLLDSIYNPTGQEKLKLTKKETPYYWRVKAVDGTYNESAWAPAMPFYVDFSATPRTDRTKYIFYGAAAMLVLASGILYVISRMKGH